MPIRWPMSLNNCLGCVCVCVSEGGYPLFPLPSDHSLPMTNRAGAIFLVQLTTRQFAGHPLGLRGQGNRGSLLLLYSMLLIKFCCHLPTPSPPPMFLRASCALFHFGYVVGNFFKIVLVTFKLVSEWQQWSFAKMLSFRCCKVFIVALFTSSSPTVHAFSTLLTDQKKEEPQMERAKGKEGEHPHYSKFLAKSYCWLFFIFALLLHCLLSSLFVTTLPIRIFPSHSLPASFPLYILILRTWRAWKFLFISANAICRCPLPVSQVSSSSSLSSLPFSTDFALYKAWAIAIMYERKRRQKVLHNSNNKSNKNSSNKSEIEFSVLFRLCCCPLVTLFTLSGPSSFMLYQEFLAKRIESSHWPSKWSCGRSGRNLS